MEEEHPRQGAQLTRKGPEAGLRGRCQQDSPCGPCGLQGGVQFYCSSNRESWRMCEQREGVIWTMSVNPAPHVCHEEQKLLGGQEWRRQEASEGL